LEEQLQQPTLEKLTDASATRTWKHPSGILYKEWPDVCPRYRDIPPQSPVYVSKKDRQLGCQRVNSHQAGIVDSQIDHNEQGIELKTCQGYRKQVVQKTTEDLEQIQDPRSSMANAIDEIPRQALYMCSPLRLVWLWRDYLHYLSVRNLVFSPYVKGGSQITLTILDF
jgi:hypothetical protein